MKIIRSRSVAGRQQERTIAIELTKRKNRVKQRPGSVIIFLFNKLNSFQSKGKKAIFPQKTFISNSLATTLKESHSCIPQCSIQGLHNHLREHSIM